MASNTVCHLVLLVLPNFTGQAWLMWTPKEYDHMALEVLEVEDAYKYKGKEECFLN